MWILTFHSACARILRREHHHLGVPSGFTIYDDGDTERLIAGILRDLDLDLKRFAPRAVAHAIGRAKDQVIAAEQFAQMASNFYEETVAKVYAAYEARKHAAGALDFDDLIGEAVKLFRDHLEVRAHYQERFRYIMIDEYQDTNRAQYQLVNMLAEKYRGTCASVGDADQERVQLAQRHHPAPPGFRTRHPRTPGFFLMAQNYRWSQNILHRCEASPSTTSSARPDSLLDGPARGADRSSARYDEHEEAFFLVDEIRAATPERWHRYSVMAVFYRSTQSGH